MKLLMPLFFSEAEEQERERIYAQKNIFSFIALLASYSPISPY
jgi:hypothetical protein